jgi:hypothetical protein
MGKKGRDGIIQITHLDNIQQNNSNIITDGDDMLNDTQLEENKNDCLDEEDDLGWDENLIETGENSFPNNQSKQTN